jgi:hypothetical protein
MATLQENYSQVVASSGNVAAGVATATLPAVTGRTNFLTGFEITGTGATVGAAVTVTVTNLIGGVTASYTYASATGATVANTPLIVQFPEPIPASAVNTAIAVSCPSIGAGSTNNTVVAHGYYL